MARNPSPIIPSNPVYPYTLFGHSHPSGHSSQEDRPYVQQSCACFWCTSHYNPQIRMNQKARNSKGQNSKAGQARQAGKSGQARQSKKSGEDPKGIQAPKVPRRRRAAQSTGQYTVRSFLDAGYMFSEDVDPANAILPAGKLITHKSFTYALHVQIDWEGVDTEGNPYKPTWEVAYKTTLDGSAWRAFVSKKRALPGNNDWSIADIPVKRNARPGKHISL